MGDTSKSGGRGIGSGVERRDAEGCAARITNRPSRHRTGHPKGEEGTIVGKRLKQALSPVGGKRKGESFGDIRSGGFNKRFRKKERKVAGDRLPGSRSAGGKRTHTARHAPE